MGVGRARVVKCVSSDAAVAPQEVWKSIVTRV